MALRLWPVLDPYRCKGSGDCVAVCPTNCLDLRAGQPLLARPRDCISCDLCAQVCPTQAIHMEEQWCDE
jgi:NAD-dependent dihydropyrimidine dehydrogenase PreA subunit